MQPALPVSRGKKGGLLPCESLLQMRSCFVVPGLWLWLLSGCSLFPDVKHEPQFHNPFPQLYRVAVLPFYNQSTEPTLSQDRVGLAYFNELQRIPGFEVMPVGVVKRYLEALDQEPQTPQDFQQLAQSLGVDAVVVGSVTDYSPYYPPRIGLAVDWYAANPGFHPIPPGYGLPWGTDEEEDIPSSHVFESEFALAREQLATQTPSEPAALPDPRGDASDPGVLAAMAQEPAELPEPEAPPQPLAGASPEAEDRPPAGPRPAQPAPMDLSAEPAPVPLNLGASIGDEHLPQDWPDPRGFIPPQPAAERPPLRPHFGPVLTHTRLYNGHDEALTEKLAEYFYFRDDARFGGWQAYLQRSEDFIRFCCYVHVTEMLASRGGSDRTRLVLRWPIDRYER